MKKVDSKKTGFTLVEVMVAVTIAGTIELYVLQAKIVGKGSKSRVTKKNGLVLNHLQCHLMSIYTLVKLMMPPIYL